jgi:CMP-N-acetylneuraminic acid synthetase
MSLKITAMIPARLGSQRLKQKNLCEINGVSILALAVRKCHAAGCFNEIWVNSESEILGKIAEQENAAFHKRPPELANNKATSEQFVYEFLKAHACDYLVQVHSIAPLLGIAEIKAFAGELEKEKPDVMLSAVEEQIECALDGQPVNFTFKEKTNSQDLRPLQRITWSISAWKRESFIKTYEAGKNATYNGVIRFFPVSHIAGHVIKTQKDLDIVLALWPLIEEGNDK